MARPDTTQLKSLLDTAQSVLLLLPKNPHYDAVASSLSLKLALEPAGKSVSVVCPDPITVEFNRLVGIDSVSSSFGSRHLIISFPGQTDHVDKVSYNLEQGELQLVITPKPASPDLDHRRLRFVSGGGKVDLAILVGIHSLGDLGPFFQNIKDILNSSKVVSFTIDLPQENYTPHQIYDPESSSLSETTLHLIESMGLPLSLDTATNLLSGLETATDFFRSQYVTHATHESAAKLMRRGARRHQPLSASQVPPGAIPQVTSSPPVQPPASAPAPSSAAGYGTDSSADTAAPVAPEPSPDWYEPKIYSGSMLP